MKCPKCKRSERFILKPQLDNPNQGEVVCMGCSYAIADFEVFGIYREPRITLPARSIGSRESR